MWSSGLRSAPEIQTWEPAAHDGNQSRETGRTGRDREACCPPALRRQGEEETEKQMQRIHQRGGRRNPRECDGPQGGKERQMLLMDRARGGLRADVEASADPDGSTAGRARGAELQWGKQRKRPGRPHRRCFGATGHI